MLLRTLLSLVVALTSGSLAVVHADIPLATSSVLPPEFGTKTLFVADLTADAVFAIEDLNGDGDAMDAGEVRIFYDDSNLSGLPLATPRFVAIDPVGAIYVADANTDQILRLEDLDNDGDANDAGEATVYFDASSTILGFASVSNIAFDEDGFLYLTDTGTSSSTARYIAKCRDDNGDGICRDVDGEVQILWELNSQAMPVLDRPNGMFLTQAGDVYVGDFILDEIFLLCDSVASGDGDANDVGEQTSVFQSNPGGAELNFAESFAERPDVVLSFFVNPGPTEDVIYAMRDDDADGVIANPLEVSNFLDDTQADGLVLANARTLALDETGALYILEAGQSSAMVPERILRALDGNGDGDANDIGEVTIWVDLVSNGSGLQVLNGQGMAFERDPMPMSAPEFTRGDCNDSGNPSLDDVIGFLQFLFVGGSITCQDSCDFDDNGVLGLDDVIALLNFLFIGSGAQPAPPGLTCGPDVMPDAFPDCVNFSSCP